MTALDAHNPKDVTPVVHGRGAPDLGAEINPKSNTEFNAAKAGPSGHPETALNAASITPTAIHFGKHSDAAAPVAAAEAPKAPKAPSANGTTYAPDADHPVQDSKALLNMNMSQGDFDRLPKSLVGIAEALGKNGMFGLTADQRAEEGKLSPYFHQGQMLTSDLASTKVYAPTKMTDKQVDAYFQWNSRNIDALAQIKHVP